MTTIHGRLDDHRRVSLIGCHVIKQQSRSRYRGFTCSNVVFPQCIVFGDHHLSAEDAVVLQVYFSLERSVEIFDDSDAYGTIFNDSETIERIIASQHPGRTVPVGDWNWAAYYTGKKNVFSSETAIARVSADHCPTFTVGDSSPSDFGLIKKTVLSLEFTTPLTVMESLHRVDRTLQFFDLVVGRSLVVSEIRIATEMDDTPERAHVYPTAYVNDYRSREGREPGVNTILIDPVQEAGEFSSVLKQWLAKDHRWATARARLRRVWASRSYTVDRLVAAANVFELLPSDTYGSELPLPPELSSAKEQAKAIFGDLPESQERNSILGSLGRIGSWSLSKKIRHRAETVVTIIGALLPKIDDVLREAVALRNDYVHGPSRPGHERRNRHLVFLTDTLEFVFLTSDLVDAGWNITKWHKRPMSSGHPFGDFLASYSANVTKLT